MEDRILPDEQLTLADHPSMNDTQLQSINSSSYPSGALSTQALALDDSFTLDGLFSFEDYTSSQLQFPSAVSVTPCTGLVQQSASWCTWTRGGVSLSVLTENSMVDMDSNLHATMHRERPYAQHNADLVIQSLRSFPAMMLRRETFPWFIHPHHQAPSKETKPHLPQALSTCMSIAQMFALRTSETKSFLWCTVRAEYRRFINEVIILFTWCFFILTIQRSTTCPYPTSLPQFKLALFISSCVSLINPLKVRRLVWRF
jgi:hypothetical protein